MFSIIIFSISSVISSSAEQLQKKIKVISRCQDVMKMLSEERKFTGRLTVQPSKSTTTISSKTDTKYQSPLRKIPVVRFQFTNPCRTYEDGEPFINALDRLLDKVGVKKPSKISATNQIGENQLNINRGDPSVIKFVSETRQECLECKRRASITLNSVATQCINRQESKSVATQVYEEDFPRQKGVLKTTDSIASMTPAQLLGQETSTMSTNYSMQPMMSRRIPQPHPQQGIYRGSFNPRHQQPNVFNRYGPRY